MTETIDAITPDRELVETIAKLRERPYDKSTWGPVIACSLILHFLLLPFFLFRPMTTTAKLTFGTYYTVDLVHDVGYAGPSHESGSFSEEMKNLLSDKQEIVLRKKTKFSEAPPIKRLDIRDRTSPDVSRAIDTLKKKVGSPLQNKTAAAPAMSAGSGSAAAPDEWNAYYGTIWSRIKAKWAFPGGLAAGKDLVAVVQVRIMRNGAAEAIALQERSANSQFNESALRAVKKASPFPSFPAGIGEDSIELGIRFHSSQLVSR